MRRRGIGDDVSRRRTSPAAEEGKFRRVVRGRFGGDRAQTCAHELVLSVGRGGAAPESAGDGAGSSAPSGGEAASEDGRDGANSGSTASTSTGGRRQAN
uniref:Uncharacterized protein n=1 Tax=Oryza officinalis TaxID=4535 RepID=A0A1V1H7R5_9ORYZ|nr:hypothetical protein [Oryza officinalis]